MKFEKEEKDNYSPEYHLSLGILVDPFCPEKRTFIINLKSRMKRF